VTLETIGLEDFNGKLPSVTFTAHPKLDPETGDLVCFGYEARGEATPDICLFTVASEGEMKEVVWLESPVLAMIHDFAVTKNWVSCVRRLSNTRADRSRFSFLSSLSCATSNG
jgi:carotenoid cleavage dioxygenase